jgi:transporter family protein
MNLTAQPWFVWALGSAGFAALTAVFAKVGVEGIDSDLATFIRTIVVAVLLGLSLLATGKLQNQTATISPRTYLFLALSGAATGASWVCYFRALQLGDAARVAPVDKLSVVMVAIFAVLFLGERLTSVNWAGICLVAVGVILIAYKG